MNLSGKQRRQPQTAQAVALAELRELILTGAIRPGEALVQDAMAARLGLSRVPVREALKILEGEGLVTYSTHRGYTVVRMDLEEVLEVYRIRDLLEDEAARLAVDRLSEEDFERMASANARLELAHASGDLVEILWANREFHFTLFNRGGTGRLSNLIRVVWDSIEPHRSQYFAESEHYGKQIREHETILQRARERDSEGVVTLSRAHRRFACEKIVSIMSEDSVIDDDAVK